MGRSRNFIGNKRFQYSKGSAICTIEGCQYEYKPKNGSSSVHATPLIGHLKKKHPEVYEEEGRKLKEETVKKRSKYIDSFFDTGSSTSTGTATKPAVTTISFPLTKQGMRDMAVEAVTVNGLPLTAFEKSGLAKMLAPVLDQLNMKLTAANIRAWTIEAAQKKMAETRGHFAGKFVSVKADLCTRRGRHFIGINLQAVVDGELKVITAAVTELHERATAVAIRSNIIRCLAKHGISENQIYSLTTDNGSNVLKVGELMRNDFAMSHATCVEDTSECNGIDAHDDELEAGVITSEHGVITVRCAVHTLQLCVHDFFKFNPHLKDVVAKVRNVVKKTHNHNIRELFKHNDKPLPCLDCETRWGSTFQMLESVLATRSLLDHIALANESLLLSNEDWLAVQELVECLKSVYNTTIAIQLKNLTAGEFFGEWLKCKCQLQRNSVTSGCSVAMLRAMESRESTLLSNAAFLAAIYVDPRFQVLLKCDQKTIAQAHLASLWRRFRKMQESLDMTDPETSSESETGSACGSDMLEEILQASDACSSSRLARCERDVVELIKGFHSQPRLPKNINILQWWNKQPETDFKHVAAAALALPVTQASVERTFSGLRYILHDLRLGLKEDIIEAIMFLRCNT